ncbi:MAG: TRZ/ATZ family hydrolase [Pseudomonadota bacterium]
MNDTIKKQADSIIAGTWVLPIKPDNTVLEQHSVVTKDDSIIDILPTTLARKQYQTKQFIDRPNHVVMPGLINAHTHNSMNLLRSFADDKPFFEWWEKYIRPVEEKFISHEFVEHGTTLAIAEMIRGGITCFNDMYFYPNQSEKIMIEYGMRGCLGLGIDNTPDPDGGNVVSLERAKNNYDNRTNHPLISWTVAPHAPYSNNDDNLRKAKEYADQWGMRIHIHLQETKAELEKHCQQYGQSPVQRLDRLGLLSEKLIAVHVVHISEEDSQLLQQRGVHIVHCPESNLKLASGIAPVARFLDQKINVAIGTDGAASNNDLDLFAEMRTAALLAKGVTHDATALPAEQALAMGTINGARALGLEDKIGSLEIGKQADIITVNLDHPFTQPIYHPISLLVYATDRSQVADVWIAGQQLLNQGEFTQLDYNAIIAKTQKLFSLIRAEMKD